MSVTSQVRHIVGQSKAESRQGNPPMLLKGQSSKHVDFPKNWSQLGQRATEAEGAGEHSDYGTTESFITPRKSKFDDFTWGFWIIPNVSCSKHTYKSLP